MIASENPFHHVESLVLRRTWIPLAAVALVLASTGLLAFRVEVPVLTVLAQIVFWFVFLASGFWLASKAYQRLLWRVSGRLAFSYFLIGVVPIPLVGALVLLVGWVLSGFFLGHLFRADLLTLVRQTVAAAAHASGEATTEEDSPFAFAHYAGGVRVAGDPRAPATWPEWLAVATRENQGKVPQFVTLPGGDSTLAAAVGAERPGSGTLAFVHRDVGELLRSRAGFWIGPLQSADDRESSRISVGSTELNFRAEPSSKQEMVELGHERRQFFLERSKGSRWLDSPFVRWVHRTPPSRDFATGADAEAGGSFVLAATLRMVGRPLASADTEFSEFVWVAFLALSVLLFVLYAVAELIALTLIFGLSRAVSRLYRATTQIAEGDFSVRIPVRRTDQVGALQQAFNTMAANLQDLVATAAQKELLDKELEIAREVQKSLLPQSLPTREALDLATLFEPSAAIGGDYFDILRWGDDHLAVVIADVSGHGLPTGLRMAMVKAALQILVEQCDDPTEILGRLDGVVRGEGGERFFVTATLGRLDFRRGKLELANAGHPPTYLLSGGTVREILLPGSPLGALRRNYGQATLDIADGDVLVWLSDGLVEASDPAGDPFGYDRIVDCLAGTTQSATEVRDRLLAAVAAHARGTAASDDRTLVVLRYTGSSTTATKA
ncbi:MAG: SpoIIE family protein phosphatase [Thermoanaerobaculia bacterium]|nr:SpoIIE family protein phosphatase [Thermoanaerobaculia bacterium]